MGSARCKHRVGKTCMIFVAVGAKLAHRAKHGDLAARGRGFTQSPERRRHGGGFGVLDFVEQSRRLTADRYATTRATARKPPQLGQGGQDGHTGERDRAWQWGWMSGAG